MIKHFLRQFLIELQYPGRPVAALTYSILIGVLMAGIFSFTQVLFHQQSTPASLCLQLLVTAFLSLWHSAILCTSMYVASCTYSCWPKTVVGRSLFVLTLLGGAVTGSFIVLWSTHAFLYLAGSTADSISNIPLRLAFSLFLCLMFSAAAYAYESVRLKLLKSQEVLKVRMQKEQRLEKLKSQAEIQALQARINPHFLFNTLNSIATLIAIQPGKAEEAVVLLSNLFRTSLRHSLDGKATLEQSMVQVETYLKLEKMRLGDRLQYSIALDPGLAQMWVPELLLQPLVENAIKHGLGPKVSGGEVRISAVAKDHLAILRIEDNGVGWQSTSSTQGTGYGLNNIRERLRLIYHDAAHLDIEVPESGGCRITISIPHSNN